MITTVERVRRHADRLERLVAENSADVEKNHWIADEYAISALLEITKGTKYEHDAHRIVAAHAQLAGRYA